VHLRLRFLSPVLLAPFAVGFSWRVKDQKPMDEVNLNDPLNWYVSDAMDDYIGQKDPKARKKEVPDTTPPRNIIYFSSDANQIPLAGIAELPYTDIIVGFLVPDANLDLQGAGGAFNRDLQSNIQALQSAGKNVLISVGGGTGFTSADYQSYAQNVNGLVDQIVNFVTTYGFNGVDIDYEDSTGFTGGYDGIGFLTALTSALAGALPLGQNIVTHAPQTPYWDAKWNQAPYAQIWEQVGDQIAWINNQFYNNPPWDATPELKVQWYQNVAAITGAQKLMLGALIAQVGKDEGYLPLAQMTSDVIAPLQLIFGPQFGGVMGWQFAFDQAGNWANGIGQAIEGAGS
jgi:chitinase